MGPILVPEWCSPSGGVRGQGPKWLGPTRWGSDPGEVLEILPGKPVPATGSDTGVLPALHMEKLGPKNSLHSLHVGSGLTESG